MNRYLPYPFFSGNYSVTGFEMILKRRMSHYMITYYLPSSLFVVVSWTSFLIPSDDIQGRMALLVTLFLVLVSKNIFQIFCDIFTFYTFHIKWLCYPLILKSLISKIIDWKEVGLFERQFSLLCYHNVIHWLPSIKNVILVKRGVGTVSVWIVTTCAIF